MTTSIVTLALNECGSREELASLTGCQVLSVSELGATHLAIADNLVAGDRDSLQSMCKKCPLDHNQARELMDDRGFITVVLLLDKDNFLEAVITSASDTDNPYTPEDYAHEAAFDFGRTQDSSAEIIGVSGAFFIVSYSTQIGVYLAS